MKDDAEREASGKAWSHPFLRARATAARSAGRLKDFLASSAIWWWISSIVVGAWIFAMVRILL